MSNKNKGPLPSGARSLYASALGRAILDALVICHGKAVKFSFLSLSLLAVVSVSSMSMASIIGQSLPLILLLATSIYSSPINSARAVHITDLNNLKESYDYVIIGGGTSGLTVADRLTEDPKGRFTLCRCLDGSSLGISNSSSL